MKQEQSEKRAFPEVSAEGLMLIGKGSTASVYRLDSGHVLKVYDSKRYRNNLDFIKREARVSHAVCESGLPGADSHEIVRCGEYYACIYDMVQGDTLGDVILKKPDELEMWVTRMAALARQIHAAGAPDGVFPAVNMLTKLYPYLEPWLSVEELDRFRSLAETVPDRPYMVHTDFHFDNVLVQDGRLVLIDVGGMSHGHPVYDLLSLYRRAHFPGETRSKLSPEMNGRFYELYLAHYYGMAFTPAFAEKIERAVSFLTRCIRVAVPCAGGTPDTFPDGQREQMEQELKKLLLTGPDEARAWFADLIP